MELIIAVGKKASGKTFSTLQQINFYLKNSRRVLIFDINDEYLNVKPIKIKNISYFVKRKIASVKRIRPFLDNGTKMSLYDVQKTLSYILGTYKDGVLIIEDANKIIDAKNFNFPHILNMDIIMHYNSIGSVSTDILSKADIVRLHSTIDRIIKYKTKMDNSDFECFSISESIINEKYKQGNKHCFINIDRNKNNIYGDFTNKEYSYAVNEFLMNDVVPKIRKKLFKYYKN